MCRKVLPVFVFFVLIRCLCNRVCWGGGGCVQLLLWSALSACLTALSPTCLVFVLISSCLLAVLAFGLGSLSVPYALIHFLRYSPPWATVSRVMRWNHLFCVTLWGMWSKECALRELKCGRVSVCWTLQGRKVSALSDLCLCLCLWVFCHFVIFLSLFLFRGSKLSAWKEGCQPRVVERPEEEVSMDNILEQELEDSDDCVFKLSTSFSNTASFASNKCRRCWLLKKNCVCKAMVRLPCKHRCDGPSITICFKLLLWSYYFSAGFTFSCIKTRMVEHLTQGKYLGFAYRMFTFSFMASLRMRLFILWKSYYIRFGKYQLILSWKSVLNIGKVRLAFLRCWKEAQNECYASISLQRLDLDSSICRRLERKCVDFGYKIIFCVKLFGAYI